MWHAAPWMEQKLGPWMEDHHPLLNAYAVVIANKRGKRLVYIGPLAADTKEQAEALALFINMFVGINPDWEPTDKYWAPMYPVYGSEEYIDTNEEENWAAQERQLDVVFKEKP